MPESVHVTLMARPRKPSITLPAHVHRVVSRGREYYTYQKGRGTKAAGPRVKLPHPTDPEFFATYYAVSQEEPSLPGSGTFDALIAAWQKSPEWSALAPKTSVEWTRYVSRISLSWGDLSVTALEPKHVLALRDKFANTPAAANNLLRCLSSMLSWCVPRGWRLDNPCHHVRKLKGSEPYEPWPWSAIELAKHHLRSDLWWAAALALYTGQRQGDVLTMRWDALEDGIIFVAQEKTKKRLAVPVHRDLRAILDQIPKRSVVILTSTIGTPWTQDGFRASWNGALGTMSRPNPLRPIRRAGLVFHGLRKSAVVMLLEAGCTTAEVAAITGQSFEMVEHYALDVNQRKLAAAAILKWENAQRT